MIPNILIIICILTTTYIANAQTICNNEAECREKFNELNTGGSFFVDIAGGTLKGCFTKVCGV